MTILPTATMLTRDTITQQLTPTLATTTQPEATKVITTRIFESGEVREILLTFKYQ